MPDIKVFDTVDELITSVAKRFLEIGKKAILSRGHFHVVLSGGNSPRKLYELLAKDYRTSLDWQKVKFFFGDERYVPADHPDNNALMAKSILVSALNIPEQNIFAIDTSLPVEKAAADYESRINKEFSNDRVVFDLVLLGMGDDAHTASLFPGTKVLHEKASGVRSVYLEKQQVHRLTMTAKLINQADHIVFLVYGASKADAVSSVLLGSHDIDDTPALLIHSETGSTEFYLDAEASGRKL